MKNFLYILVAALLISGCAYKNESIELPVYDGQYSGEVSKEHKAVYLQSVNDLREDKKVIGYTLVNGEKDVTLHSDADFVKSYTDGLRLALEEAGYKLVSNATDAELVLDVNIKSITITYDNRILDSNLQGALVVGIVVKNSEKTTTLNFRPKASKWIAPSNDSKDIEPFLYTLFVDNINEITSQLANY